MNRLLRELQEEFAKYFGDRWPFMLISILCLILWPALVFYPRISFDPADFTEEWVKMGFGSLLLIIMIEILNQRRAQRVRFQTTATLIEACYIEPLSRLKALLEDNGFVQEEGTQPPDLEFLGPWNRFENNLRQYAGNVELQVAGPVFQLFDSTNLKRCRRILTELQVIKRGGFNRDEHSEVLALVCKALDNFESLRDTLHR